MARASRKKSSVSKVSASLPDDSGGLRKLTLGLALALTVAAIYLHVVNFLCAGPLWRDETAFITVATMPSWMESCRSFAYEAFLIVPFALARLWHTSGLGASDMGLRSGGLIVGLSLLGILWLKSLLTKTGPPLLSIALLGFAPVIIRCGDAVRGYGVGACLILLTFLLVWKVVELPTIRWGLLAGLAALLSVQCLYVNSFLLAAIGLSAIAVSLRRRLWVSTLWVAGLCAISAISLLPYVLAYERVRTWNIILKTHLTWGLLGEGVAAALVASWNYMPWVWLALVLGALITAVLAQRTPAAPGPQSRRQDLLLYAGLTLLLAIVAQVVFLRWLDYRVRPWYSISFMTVAAVAVEVILVSVVRARVGARSLLLLAATVLALLTWESVFNAVHVRQTNMDVATDRLAWAVGPSDLVIVNTWHYAPSFQRYYQGTAPWVTIPPMSDTSIHRYDLMKEKMLEDEPLRPIQKLVVDTLSSGHRVWVVGVFFRLDPDEAPGYYPPAPHFGWDADEYLKHWSRQVAYLMRVYAQDRHRIELPSVGPVNPLETVVLRMFEGLKVGYIPLDVR